MGTLTERLVELAQTVADVPRGDLPAVASLRAAIVERAAELAGGGGPLRSAADRLERWIFGEETDEEATFSAVRDLILSAVEETVPEESGTIDGSAPDPELLAGFVVEAREHLAAAETALLALEKDPGLEEELGAVFRAFHTIKGVAGFLGLDAVGRLAHETEGLLDRARKGTVRLAGPPFEQVLAAVDGMRRLIEPEERQDEPAPAAVREGIRVDPARLDRLMDQVGELTIATAAARAALGAGIEALRNLENLGRRIQEDVIGLRLVPLEPTFGKMARLVRETARQLGKAIDFTTSGGQTELDRNVVERIGDPLVHMLRNAVDHGIEPDAAARRAAGKPDAGRIALSASQRGGTVSIEIEDDGRGLATEAILGRWGARGRRRPGYRPPESTVFGLIFEPGFSTATVVTGVSGRGVGMDVVKREVQALRGRIHIRSTPGKGSVFSLRLPLTLAILEAMLVRVGRERYFLPTVSIVRSLRPDAGDVSRVLGRGLVLRDRDGGGWVDLVSLSEAFGSGGTDDPCRGLVVLVEDAGRRIGLVVDDLEGLRSVVLKNLGPPVSDVPGMSGGAILPDGSVGLVLEVGSLVDSILRER